MLEAENRRLRAPSAEPEKKVIFEAPAPRWQVFHKLEGSTSLNEPSWVVNDSGKSLRAEMPLASVDRYLEKHPEIAFAIYKEYKKDVQSTTKGDAMVEDEMGPPEPDREYIQFTSDAMIAAVRDFVYGQDEFETQFPDFDLKEEIPAPYLFWYYIRPFYAELLGRVRVDQQPLIELLWQWIEVNYGDEYRNADDRLEKGFVSRKLMKYLVRSGDVLVSYLDNHLIAYESLTWTTMNPNRDVAEKGGKNPREERDRMGRPAENKYVYSVTAWSWDYDDDDFYQRKRDLDIALTVSGPDDEIPIAGLDVFPLRYADEEVKGILKRRGETYWGCRHQKLIEYDEGSQAAITPDQDFERYMIDSVTFRKLHRESSVLKRPRRAAETRTVSKSAGPQGNEIYLFPQTIKGYNLRRKKWFDLDVDKIREVKWNKKAFERLVVNKETKELIQALVMTRLQAEKGTDLISGKGNGLIMLLHGGPGTGKTFTAETVAELAGKPLYRVTCGDIGTKPEDVEQYLESVLHLGKIWGCVVLLDEADVFLEERSLSDLDRNALVSVFLRVLEYYDGILILTSNRVCTFDSAFKSRIQLALRYEKLETSQRRKIWWNFMQHFKDMKDNSIDFDDLDDHVDELAVHEMNGRQIRNAITTARQLAQYRKVRMDFSHLQHVIQVSGRFEDYLKSVNEGRTEEEMNRLNGIA
ncbi:AAA family ATPase [Hypoxylon sp. FL1857]|nr:AAA family ATPase [Hypoxylon sp. FL1857]